MKKLLLILFIAIVAIMPAIAVVPAMADTPYGKSPAGHWYFSADKRIVLVCTEDKYITDVENETSVMCLSELAQKRVDAWMSKLVKVGTTFVRK